MKMGKRIVSLFLALALMVNIVPMSVFAAEDDRVYDSGEETLLQDQPADSHQADPLDSGDAERPLEEEEAKDSHQDGAEDGVTASGSAEMILSPSQDGAEDPQELYRLYAQRLFDEAAGRPAISLYGTAARDYLESESEQAYYDFLKEEIGKVANGSSATTIFMLNRTDNQPIYPELSWTLDELGIESAIERAPDGEWTFTEEAATAVSQKFGEAFNTQRVLDALLADCPMELYWYDKTLENGTTFGYQYSYITSPEKRIYITNMSMCFPPAEDYAESGQNYRVATEKTRAAQSSIEYAQSIVAEAAGKTDR
ncbi:MAG: hypothetical protein DBX44_02755 [Oscillospiraceae bacterium]|nr:MAG: hypothetical protein DBX44_02755 [Oscillospiraceae bacterium]